jgi:hypothetical protein
MDSTEFNIFFLLNLYSTQKRGGLKRAWTCPYLFKKKKKQTTGYLQAQISATVVVAVKLSN